MFTYPNTQFTIYTEKVFKPRYILRLIQNLTIETMEKILYVPYGKLYAQYWERTRRNQQKAKYGKRTISKFLCFVKKPLQTLTQTGLTMTKKHVQVVRNTLQYCTFLRANNPRKIEEKTQRIRYQNLAKFT